jgi:hypothetical protein
MIQETVAFIQIRITFYLFIYLFIFRFVLCYLDLISTFLTLVSMLVDLFSG